MSHVFVNIMLGVLVFITAVVMIDPMQSMIDIPRDALNCSDITNATVGVRMTCIILDVQVFGYIGIIFGVGLAIIGAKRQGWIGGG